MSLSNRAQVSNRLFAPEDGTEEEGVGALGPEDIKGTFFDTVNVHVRQPADFKRVLVYGGEDEFVDEDMRKSCAQLTVISWVFPGVPDEQIQSTSGYSSRSACRSLVRRVAKSPENIHGA